MSEVLVGQIIHVHVPPSVTHAYVSRYSTRLISIVHTFCPVVGFEFVLFSLENKMTKLSFG